MSQNLHFPISDDKFSQSHVTFLLDQYPNDKSKAIEYINRFTVKTPFGIFHKNPVSKRWSPVSMTILKLICVSDQQLLKAWKTDSLLKNNVEIVMDPDSSDVIDEHGHLTKINLWVNTFPQLLPFMTNDDIQKSVSKWTDHIHLICNHDSDATENLINHFAQIFQRPGRRLCPVVFRNPTHHQQFITSIFVPISQILGPLNFVSLVGKTTINSSHRTSRNDEWAQSLIMFLMEPFSKTDVDILDNEIIAIKHKRAKAFNIKNIINLFMESNTFVMRSTRPHILIQGPDLSKNPQFTNTLTDTYFDCLQSVSPDALFLFLINKKV